MGLSFFEIEVDLEAAELPIEDQKLGGGKVDRLSNSFENGYFAFNSLDRVAGKILGMHAISKQNFVAVSDAESGFCDPDPEVKVLCASVNRFELSGRQYHTLASDRPGRYHIAGEIEQRCDRNFALRRC